MDILQTERWLFKLLEEENIEDEPISDFFADSGFQSMSALRNLGSTLIYLIVYLFAFLVMGFLKLLNRGTAVYEGLKKRLMWSSSIRFVIQQYQPIMIATLINLYDVRNALNDLFSFDSIL